MTPSTSVSRHHEAVLAARASHTLNELPTLGSHARPTPELDVSQQYMDQVSPGSQIREIYARAKPTTIPGTTTRYAHSEVTAPPTPGPNKSTYLDVVLESGAMLSWDSATHVVTVYPPSEGEKPVEIPGDLVLSTKSGETAVALVPADDSRVVSIEGDKVTFSLLPYQPAREDVDKFEHRHSASMSPTLPTVGRFTITAGPEVEYTEQRPFSDRFPASEFIMAPIGAPAGVSNTAAKPGMPAELSADGVAIAHLSNGETLTAEAPFNLHWVVGAGSH